MRSRLFTVPAAAATVTLLALGLTGCSASNDQSTPENTVKSFFQDVKDKNYDQLAALLDTRKSEVAALSASFEKYKPVSGEGSSISDWTVDNVSASDSSTVETNVDASYKDYKGKTQQTQFTLKKGGPDGNSWYIDPSDTLKDFNSTTSFEYGKSQLYVISDGKRVKYDGQMLIPGLYKLQLVDKSGIFQPEDITNVRMTLDGSSTVEPKTSAVKLTAKATSSFTNSVKKWLTTCNDSTTTAAEAEDNAAGDNTEINTCPSWTSATEYDYNGGDYTSGFGVETSGYENAESSEPAYESHPKFHIIEQPTVKSVEWDASDENIKVKLAGGSYELWTWQDDFSDTDGVMFFQKARHYTYKWSVPETFDKSMMTVFSGDGSDVTLDVDDFKVQTGNNAAPFAVINVPTTLNK